MLDYKTHADNESMYNTPPCYSIYVCGLVFDYLLKKGRWEKTCRGHCSGESYPVC